MLLKSHAFVMQVDQRPWAHRAVPAPHRCLSGSAWTAAPHRCVRRRAHTADARSGGDREDGPLLNDDWRDVQKRLVAAYRCKRMVWVGVGVGVTDLNSGDVW